MTHAPTPRRILGRRRRPTLLTDLPDELLLNIISHVLQTRPSSLLSARSIARFRSRGRVIALLSRRFLRLLRTSVRGIEAASTDHTWAAAMLVFARRSLSALHVAAPPCGDSSHLCMLLAEVRPPLRQLALGGGVGGSFEHIVKMLRGLPLLRELDLQTPRPADVAAVTRACVGLRRVSLGAVSTDGEVDEMRRQFIKLVCSPVGAGLVVLNISWSCATVEAFQLMQQHCRRLERFGAEFGAMHWIRHRAFKAASRLHVNLREYGREQRTLVQAMVTAVGAGGGLRSFAVRTVDRSVVLDLEGVFGQLRGLQDFDLLIGGASMPEPMSACSFEIMRRQLSCSLRRVNVVGVSFSAEQAETIAREFQHVTSLSLCMVEGQSLSPEVLRLLGTRMRHMSILCEWTEEMCKAAGAYNTKLESIFMVARKLPIDAVANVLQGACNSMKEFRLFVNQKRNMNREALEGAGGDERIGAGSLGKVEAKRFVHEAAKMVAKACAETLEVVNISITCGIEKWYVDCSEIAPQLRKIAPHLWQVCDLDVES